MDVPVERVLFSGATLAHIVQECKAAAGDCDGLLFGHVRQQTIPSLQDDEGPATREQVSAMVTGHFSSGRVMSFYDAVGAIDRARLGAMVGEREARGADPLIGWYIARRNSSMRPSMRETAVTAYLKRSARADAGRGKESAGADALVAGEPLKAGADPGLQHLSQAGRGVGVRSRPVPIRTAVSELISGGDDGALNEAGTKAAGSPVEVRAAGLPASAPCLFLLMAESETQNLVLTHDYRAFQYHPRSQGRGSFQPRPVSIVNIGPVFRGQYDSFAPFAPFPPLTGIVHESDDEDGSEGAGWQGNRPMFRKIGGGKDVEAAQALLNVYADGFSVDTLFKLVRPDRLGCSTELEDLYARMLSKLEVVAKRVQESTAALAEQEKLRAKLRTESEQF